MERPSFVVPPDYYTPDEALALLAGAAVTLSCRYHFTVQSVLAGTVPVTLARSAKMTDLLDELGGAPVGTLERVDAGAVAEEIGRAWTGGTASERGCRRSRRPAGRGAPRATWISGRRTEVLLALWRHRSFVLAGALRELKQRYAGSGMGVLWHVVTPLAQIARLLRGVLALHGGAERHSAGGAYAVFLCAGILPWFVFAECVAPRRRLAAGERGLPQEAADARRACSWRGRWPRPALTLGLYAIALLAMALLAGVPPPRGAGCCSPGVLALFVCFCFGFALVLAVVTVFFRDVAQIMAIVLQFWFWLTPIVYDATSLGPRLTEVMRLEPAVTPYILAVRGLLVEGTVPAAGDWAWMAAWAVGLCLAGGPRSCSGSAPTCGTPCERARAWCASRASGRGSRSTLTPWHRAGEWLSGGRARPALGLLGLAGHLVHGRRAGECFGVIGPNGSGKTTLLKVLSGVLQPTEGRFELSAPPRSTRCSSWAPASTPDLTGRENVYQSARLLGLPPGEPLSRRWWSRSASSPTSATSSTVPCASTPPACRCAWASRCSRSCEPELLVVDEASERGRHLLPAEVRGSHRRDARGGRQLPVRLARHGGGAPALPRGPGAERTAARRSSGPSERGVNRYHGLIGRPGPAARVRRCCEDREADAQPGMTAARGPPRQHPARGRTAARRPRPGARWRRA